MSHHGNGLQAAGKPRKQRSKRADAAAWIEHCRCPFPPDSESFGENIASLFCADRFGRDDQLWLGYISYECIECGPRGSHTGACQGSVEVRAGKFFRIHCFGVSNEENSHLGVTRSECRPFKSTSAYKLKSRLVSP